MYFQYEKKATVIWQNALSNPEAIPDCYLIFNGPCDL